MTTLNYKATCFHCKRGEQDVFATHFVTGHNGKSPFSGYVCDDHLEVIADDVTKQQVINLDYLVQKYTAFTGFDDMIKATGKFYTPTIRTDVDLELKIVRRAFNDRMIELGLPNRI